MNIIIYGFGQMGRKLIDECLGYECDVTIVAIADSYSKLPEYNGIPVIRVSKISEYEYDEIWVTTVYYEEVLSALKEAGISEDHVCFREPVVPILEYRMRQMDIEVTEDNSEALDYFKRNHLRMYCYPFYDEYFVKKTEIEYDESAKLYYGQYKGKRVYLARRYDSKEKARAYLNSVIMEQDERSPHCYLKHKSIREQKGVAVDVGAAEGIYGLAIIDDIDHLYAIEGDPEWIDAMRHTFSAYSDKVTIIEKFVGNEDKEDFVRLDTILMDCDIDTIKMDIEGWEMDALQGAESVLERCNVHLAICCYHHKDDNDKITAYLSGKGFNTVNSGGVVVCFGDWELERDEAGFRKALIFADKEQ